MPNDPRVLLGVGDDAGVYKIRDDLALVQTVDFFTPIVDDPVGFGMVAAANSLSDVYAMGATPLTALNIVCFPEKGPLDMGILAKILEGGYRKAGEAGVSIIGGHSVDDKEPKYGLAVTGTVHPDEILSKKGARPGDLLVLTKPLGTGVLATALKADMEPEGTDQLLIDICAFLNDKAAQAARKFGVHAVTDVTGFGLILHLLEILEASDVGARLWFDQLPLLPGVDECVDMGLVPAGTYANRDHAGERLIIDEAVTDEQVLLANDAQTSGGLLLAVPPEKAEALVAELAELGVPANAVIGKVTDQKHTVRLQPGR